MKKMLPKLYARCSEQASLLRKCRTALLRETKYVVQRSAVEARRLGHNYVGTEHLLIALLRGETSSIAAKILISLGANPQKLYSDVLNMLSDDDGEAIGNGSQYGGYGQYGTGDNSEKTVRPQSEERLSYFDEVWERLDADGA